MKSIAPRPSVKGAFGAPNTGDRSPAATFNVARGGTTGPGKATKNPSTSGKGARQASSGKKAGSK